jgi:predicted NAD/FAD-binding protein
LSAFGRNALRIGIIGSGIAGMTAAHLLQDRHEVHLFEADGRPGGHAHTVTVDLPEGAVAADTGFLVYNEQTYPLFTRLLGGLGVATHPSDMSFSLSDLRCGLEWRGTSLSTVFAQRRNVARPAFLAMLADVVRFNRLASTILAEAPDGAGSGTLADLLARRRWSQGFLDWYLIPLGSAIWSADPATFTQIPARTFVEFFSRHGLLGPGHQPSWRTVTGGSARYVESILQPLRKQGRLHVRTGVAKLRRQQRGVELLTAGGPTIFDHVVVATHSDQALALLGDPTPEERRVLGAFRYQPNRATLHTDTTLLPANRRAWASWNYVRPLGTPDGATLTYYLNRLQGLPSEQPVLVTLNRDEAIDPRHVVARFDYEHPIVDQDAVDAQSDQRALSAGTVSYCGAYWGFGFHEDGVRSALAVCERFGAKL